MNTLRLTFALLVLTLMSCSTDDGLIPNRPNGTVLDNGDEIEATWQYIRYELYAIGETVPYEIGIVDCGRVFTVTGLEDEGRYRAEITECSGGYGGGRYWARVGEDYSRVYTDENNTDLEIRVDGWDMTMEVLGAWDRGTDRLVAYYRDAEGM